MVALAAMLVAACSQGSNRAIVQYARTMEPFVAAVQPGSTASAASVYQYSKIEPPRSLNAEHMAYVSAGITYLLAREHSDSVAGAVDARQPPGGVPAACVNIGLDVFPTELVQACAVTASASGTLTWAEIVWARALGDACGQSDEIVADGAVADCAHVGPLATPSP